MIRLCMRKALTARILVAALIVGHQVLAADPIGQVKTLSGVATVERDGKPTPATIGMSVFAADTLSTDAKGRLGMTFIDNSMISVGPNSTLSLEKFRFNTTTYEGEFESNLKRGTLAAVSGRIAKQTPEAMTVRTPSAVLGVRGTKFLVQVGGG